MSLHHLGIAHVPVLHRQFSSPTASFFAESVHSQDLHEDNKDVLIERLNDLVSRLCKETSVEDRIVTAIHSQVDSIELLFKNNKREPRSGSREESQSMKLPRDDDTFWAPRTPTRNLTMSLPSISRHSPRQSNSLLRLRPQTAPGDAVKVANEASELVSSLSNTVTQLRIRKEESDHIHDMLVYRAERAAERILLLEYRIAEMEDDFEANQSELKYLRIQMQAIQAQCSQYIPRDEDQELSESIMNWKIDWEDIDRRSKERRKNCNTSNTRFGDVTTPGIPLRSEQHSDSAHKVV